MSKEKITYTKNSFSAMSETTINKLKKYIIASKTKSIPLDIIIKYIKDNNLVLYGKSAIEHDNNMKLTFPILLINTNNILMNLLKKLRTDYNIFYDPPIKVDWGYPIKMNVYETIYIYTYFIPKKYILEKKGIYYIHPLISFGNIFYNYINPLKFDKITKKEVICITDNFCNNNIYDKISYFKIFESFYTNFIMIQTLDKFEYNSIFNRHIEKKYLKNNKNIIITGIHAYYNISESNNTEDIYNLLCINIEDEIDKIKKIDKDILIIDNIIEILELKMNIYTIYKNDKVIMRLFDMNKKDYIFNHNEGYTNLHGTYYFLLIIFFITKDDTYIKYLNNLYTIIIKEDILKKGKYECFQDNILDENIKYIINLKK